MHYLALGAFCQEMAEFLNENLWGVLMHLLALGAFCPQKAKNPTAPSTTRLNAPFGARCFLSGDLPVRVQLLR